MPSPQGDRLLAETIGRARSAVSPGRSGSRTVSRARPSTWRTATSRPSGVRVMARTRGTHAGLPYSLPESASATLFASRATSTRCGTDHPSGSVRNASRWSSTHTGSTAVQPSPPPTPRTACRLPESSSSPTWTEASSQGIDGCDHWTQASRPRSGESTGSITKSGSAGSPESSAAGRGVLRRAAGDHQGAQARLCSVEGQPDQLVSSGSSPSSRCPRAPRNRPRVTGRSPSPTTARPRRRRPEASARGSPSRRPQLLGGEVDGAARSRHAPSRRRRRTPARASAPTSIPARRRRPCRRAPAGSGSPDRRSRGGSAGSRRRHRLLGGPRPPRRRRPGRPGRWERARSREGSTSDAICPSLPISPAATVVLRIRRLSWPHGRPLTPGTARHRLARQRGGPRRPQTVRKWAADRVLPHIADWFENGELPGSANWPASSARSALLGMHLDGYGCAGASRRALRPGLPGAGGRRLRDPLAGVGAGLAGHVRHPPLRLRGAEAASGCPAWPPARSSAASG